VTVTKVSAQFVRISLSSRPNWSLEMAALPRPENAIEMPETSDERTPGQRSTTSTQEFAVNSASIPTAATGAYRGR
jgi:hypothetical protein